MSGQTSFQEFLFIFFIFMDRSILVARLLILLPLRIRQ